MATWPSKFPRPQRKAYSGKTTLPVRVTKFPASTKRRKLYEDSWTIINLEMYMDLEQFEYFWSWIRYKAEEGSNVITMPVLDSDGTVTNIDGFIEIDTISWNFEETVWKVKFDFRIPNFTVPLESTLDSWLAS